MFQNQEQLTNEVEMWFDIRETVERRVQQGLTIEQAVKEEKERYLYGSEQFLRKKKDKSITNKINTIYYEKEGGFLFGEQPQGMQAFKMDQKHTISFRELNSEEPQIIKKIKQ